MRLENIFNQKYLSILLRYLTIFSIPTLVLISLFLSILNASLVISDLNSYFDKNKLQTAEFILVICELLFFPICLKINSTNGQNLEMYYYDLITKLKNYKSNSTILPKLVIFFTGLFMGILVFFIFQTVNRNKHGYNNKTFISSEVKPIIKVVYDTTPCKKIHVSSPIVGKFLEEQPNKSIFQITKEITFISESTNSGRLPSIKGKCSFKNQYNIVLQKSNYKLLVALGKDSGAKNFLYCDDSDTLRRFNIMNFKLENTKCNYNQLNIGILKAINELKINSHLDLINYISKVQDPRAKFQKLVELGNANAQLKNIIVKVSNNSFKD